VNFFAAPLPDEYIHSVVMRYKYLNLDEGHPRKKEYEISNRRSDNDGLEYSEYLMAIINRLDLKDAETLKLKLENATTLKLPNIFNPLAYAPAVVNPTEVRACPDCLSEDCADYGFPILRTSHITYGVVVCYRHRRRLIVSCLTCHKSLYMHTLDQLKKCIIRFPEIKESPLDADHIDSKFSVFIYKILSLTSMPLPVLHPDLAILNRINKLGWVQGNKVDSRKVLELLIKVFSGSFTKFDLYDSGSGISARTFDLSRLSITSSCKLAYALFQDASEYLDAIRDAADDYKR
jgi:hypothetical protein